MTKRIERICVVTGTRAEYGLFRPVLCALVAERFDVQILATGMHLSHEFGDTYREIEADGFKIAARVDMALAGDNNAAMAKSIGIGVCGISQALEMLRSDTVLVLGDRVEALAGAVSAAAMNIVLAHIHGGDRTRGGLDESMRHAITKLAHVHFAATESSRERIVRMGEEPHRVHVTGAPGLDTILAARFLSVEELRDRLGFDLQQPYAVAVQHPVSTMPDAAPQQMEATLGALKEVGLPTVLIYPNSDAGGRRMIAVLEQYRSEPWLHVAASVAHDAYLALLKNADVLVGNSSSGIIEAPSFQLPVVNIGMRQEGRESSNNVVDAPHESEAIVEAIRTARSDKFRARVRESKNIYGDGSAGKRIAAILRDLEITQDFLQKQITY